MYVAQIPGARSIGRLNFMRRRLTFAGQQYRNVLRVTALAPGAFFFGWRLVLGKFVYRSFLFFTKL